MFKVSVIIPAFNEGKSVKQTVLGIHKVLREQKVISEILFIDDGSSDSTAVLAEEAGAKVVRSRSNLGYGASLKTGIKNSSYDTIIITDADGTYPIDMIPSLIQLMQKTDADMVVGARTGDVVAVPFVRKPFEWIVRRLAQFIVERPIPDQNSGLRIFKKKVTILGARPAGLWTALSLLERYENVEIEDFIIRRKENVCPIYDHNFVKNLKKLEDYLKTIDRTVSLGHQGLFVHDNTHHTIEMGVATADCLF